MFLHKSSQENFKLCSIKTKSFCVPFEENLSGFTFQLLLFFSILCNLSMFYLKFHSRITYHVSRSKINSRNLLFCVFVSQFLAQWHKDARKRKSNKNPLTKRHLCVMSSYDTDTRKMWTGIVPLERVSDQHLTIPSQKLDFNR